MVITRFPRGLASVYSIARSNRALWCIIEPPPHVFVEAMHKLVEHLNREAVRAADVNW
jgi:hypothetical protein